MIRSLRQGEIAELRLDHPNRLNPFSVAMTGQLVELCEDVEADERVAGVLLWGGPDRSFSVGGDFNDLRAIESKEAFADYLRLIVTSYQAVLAITKPVVAAIDRHAIGQGLQVALMSDWRVGTDRSLYQMPELANGVPCPLGSAILESLLGRAAMLHLVVGCGKLDVTAAVERQLVDEVCPADELETTALARLAELVAYPRLPYRVTKQIHNTRLTRQLEEVREPAARAHVASFFAGEAEAHFAKILGESG